MLFSTDRMFDKKHRIEKVELVKRLIRENNYQDYEKTHQQCLALGISVNRVALDRFADKLALIDKAERARHILHEADRMPTQNVVAASTPPVQQQMSAQQLPAQQQMVTQPQQHPAPAHRPQPTPPAPTLQEMTYEQVKQREAEITFELGALKIRENELINELTSLSERLNNKH